MMDIPPPLSAPTAMPLYPYQKLATSDRAEGDQDGATSFSQILERRGAGVVQSPVINSTTTALSSSSTVASLRVSPANNGLAIPPMASGAGSAVAFIDGSLFGHSTSLSGSSATAGAALSGEALLGPSSAGLAARSEAPQVERNLAENQPGQQPTPGCQVAEFLGATTKIVAGAPIQSGGTLGTAGPSDVSAIAGSMVGHERDDSGLPDMAQEDATPISSEPAEAFTADGAHTDRVGSADEVPAPNAPVAKSGIREAQIASLSPVHVALAIAADGPALRIVARVSGATAIVEDQVEHSLLAVARQGGTAVDRLRLNGVERLSLIGGEA